MPESADARGGKPAFCATTSKQSRNEDRAATMTEGTGSRESSTDASVVGGLVRKGT